MTCNNCGSTVEAFNRFCPKCGAPVQFQPPPTTSQPPYDSPQAPMYSGPTVPPPQRKSSCGKIILILGIILVLILGAVAAAVYFGYGALEQKLKSSEPYTMAVAALKESTEVKEKMGDITETGFPLGAYSEDASGTGKAAFTMSVTGSKASGQYQVSLNRSNFKWRIEAAFVKLTNGEIIQVAREPTFDSESNTNDATDLTTNDNSIPGDAISGGVMNSKATSLPKPVYPPIAKQAKASGRVVVRVVIDERGNVISANAISGSPLLRPAATAAARNAKFSPTIVGGNRVKVTGVINYDFTPE